MYNKSKKIKLCFGVMRSKISQFSFNLLRDDLPTTMAEIYKLLRFGSNCYEK